MKTFSLLLSLLLIFAMPLNAGMFKNLAKATAFYGAKKAYDVVKNPKNRKAITEKYKLYKASKKQKSINVTDAKESVKKYKQSQKEGYNKSFPQKNEVLNEKDFKELSQKAKSKTITKEEYASYKWNKDLNDNRKKAVKESWIAEKDKVLGGEQTRNWSIEQKKAIINKDPNITPKYDGQPMQGHHEYSVNKYPQQAGDKNNIYPVTKDEHLNRSHGGNFKNQTDGKPLNPAFKEQF